MGKREGPTYHLKVTDHGPRPGESPLVSVHLVRHDGSARSGVLHGWVDRGTAADLADWFRGLGGEVVEGKLIDPRPEVAAKGKGVKGG